MLARIIEPTSKLNELRVLDEPAWTRRPTRPSGSDCASTPEPARAAVLTAFLYAHDLLEVTVAADAGMVSEVNKTAMDAAESSFTPGARIPRSATSWTDGARSTRPPRCPTGTFLSNRGRPARPTSAATTRSSTSARPTGSWPRIEVRRPGVNSRTVDVLALEIHREPLNAAFTPQTGFLESTERSSD